LEKRRVEVMENSRNLFIFLHNNLVLNWLN
jgi:hypothetical protein